MRADFYPDLMACSLWPPIKANRLELPPLGDDELWSAIVEPAGRVGVTVDEALAVQLIADAAGGAACLPLVQETLVLLWDKVKERQLGLAAYRGMAEGGRSGLQVAIDRRASSVYDNLPEAAQPIARRIFLRLVQFGEGRADTRRQQTVAELRASGDDPALFDATLARLIESRLLTAGGEAGDPDRRVDIAHEALIAGWPRLQAWLGERQEAEQARRRLEGKAAEWVAGREARRPAGCLRVAGGGEVVGRGGCAGVGLQPGVGRSGGGQQGEAGARPNGETPGGKKPPALSAAWPRVGPCLGRHCPGRLVLAAGASL